MTQRGWLLRRWRRQLGWPGLAGLAMLVLAGLFYVAMNVPERVERESLEQQVAAARARAAAPARPENQGAEDRLAAFYRAFPPRETAPSWLERIYAAGSQFSLSLERGEYRLTADRSSRLLLYEINLPVHASYVQIRGFIQAVLDEVPTIALRDVQIRRATIGDAAVDAQIRFVLYLREAA